MACVVNGEAALVSQLASKTNWAIAAACFGIEAACHITNYFKGKISLKMMLKSVCVSALSISAGVVTSAGSVAAGAVIGSFFGPIGSILGIGIGLVVGTIASYFVTKGVEAAADYFVDTTKDQEEIEAKNVALNCLKIL